MKRTITGGTTARALCLLALCHAGCSQKGILWVHVYGNSAGLATPIEALRVEVTSTRLNESHTTRYPATMGTIELPTDFAYRVTGGLEDGDELVLDVFAEGGGADLMFGSVTTNFDLRHVVNVDVTLVAIGGCGDGLIDGGEDCDGVNVGGLACTDLGFTGGTLGCAGDCTYDTSGCTGNPCGNGTVDAGEDCDGTDLAGATCVSLGMGFVAGTLACAGDCTFDAAGCESAPTVPVLRRPLNGAHVGSVHAPGSLRPTFAWEASTGGTSAPSYDIEYSMDATFAAGVVTVTTSTTTNQPAADLPVELATPPVGNRYFWRVRACSGAACSAYSAPWRVEVGRVRGDLNGDGLADLAVGAPNTSPGGAAYVYFGLLGGFDTLADGTILGASSEGIGSAIAADGDLNGDGFSDLAIGATNNSGTAMSAGRVYVFFGGAGTSFDTVADGLLDGPATQVRLGASLGSGGDLNGDSFDDLVVGRNGLGASGMDPGAAYVYFGGLGATFDTAPDGVLTGAAAVDQFGRAIAAGGDVNGDGYADVVVGAPLNDAAGGSAGEAYLYLGGAGTTFDATVDLVFAGSTSGEEFGTAMALGDHNRDGFSDVAIGAPLADVPLMDSGAVRVFLGGASPDASVDLLLGGEAIGDNFGASIASGGDLNDDGFHEIVVGAPMNDVAGAGSGRAYAYLGGATPDTGADVLLNGTPSYDRAGAAVWISGDIDGDGSDDLIVGAPDSPLIGGPSGAAYIFVGGTAFNGVMDYELFGFASSDTFGSAVADIPMRKVPSTAAWCLALTTRRRLRIHRR